MKFLITSFGSFSAECIAKSIKKTPNTQIIACDIHDANYLPGSEHSDIILKAPHSSEKLKYLDFLIRTIDDQKIKFILPLTDIDVDFLSQHRSVIETQGAVICTPNDKSIALCRDKFIWAEMLRKSGFNTIPSIAKDELLTALPPIAAKPRNGRSSQGFIILDNLQSIIWASENEKFENYLFQPYLSGKHHVVDAVRDSFGNSVTVCREEVIRTANGAGLSVIVKENIELSQTTKRVLDILNIQGAVNIEYLEHNDIYYIMDINPRPSAGIEFSVLSGIDIPKYHIECFQGKKIPSEIQYPSKKFKTIYQRILA
ncbi:ATP-grasp domain-containing protein [Vreelandella stevensii]|uniref:ATP-grasp domain-containing protein n=1 Tax=Vreelandella stevensii TaxID=502821 RepID=UPI0037490C0C